MSKKRSNYDGIMYSTDSDFEYTGDEFNREEATLVPEKQKLIIRLDKKQRRGKVVTLVSGFVGSDEDLELLGKQLKQRCGVGGTVKDREITIQGDFRARLVELLEKDGYRVKQAGN